MSAQKHSGKARSKTKASKSPRSGRLRWWPFVLGLLIAPIAVKAAEVLPLIGGNGLLKLRLLFPYAMLLKEHIPGLAESSREGLAHVMLYAQFPLYGLFVMLAMKRRPWQGALGRLAAIHLAGFGLLFFLARA